VFYLVIVFGICVFKYANNFYNLTDLAIFYQAFDSLTQSELLKVPIQGNIYWADHFSLMFFIFLPIFYIWQSPVFLLFIQTLFIALAAWPLYLIARRYLSDLKSFLIVAIYLFNPFIISINLFEFHWLSFSFFLVFWMFYFYKKEKWSGFYVFLFLCFFVREDLSLFMIGFAAFILFEKTKEQNFIKAIKDSKFLAVLLISVIWFIGSWMIIKHFNQAPNKFLIYFSWLSDWKLAIKYWFSLGQLELILQIFIPFAFLPLFKIRYLLIGIFYYLMIAAAYGQPIVGFHYGALLMIPMYLATIFVLHNWKNKEFKKTFFEIYRKLSPVILIIAIIYLNAFFGPWRLSDYKNEEIDLQKYFIEKIESGSKVVSAAKFLPRLAEKSEIYSLGWTFWGNKQFTDHKYETGAVDYVLIDMDEFLTYELQKNQRRFYQDNYLAGFNNIQKVIKDNNLRLIENKGNYILFGKASFENNINFNNENYQEIYLNQYFPDWQGKVYLITFYNNEKKIKEQYVKPFFEIINIAFEDFDKISLQQVNIKGFLNSNHLGVGVNHITKTQKIGTEIFID